MRSTYSLPVTVVILTAALVFSAACGKKNETRTFKEEIQEKEKPAMTGHGHGMNVPGAAKTDIKWEAPEGWEEIKTESRLRLATYSVKSGEKEAICSIIPLSGDAGGLKANVQMWFASVGEKEPAMDEVDAFIAKQKQFTSKSDQPGVFIDYTTITGKESDLSIIVSVITLPGRTLFIKLTGDPEVLKLNRDKLFKLSESVESGE